MGTYALEETDIYPFKNKNLENSLKQFRFSNKNELCNF